MVVVALLHIVLLGVGSRDAKDMVPHTGIFHIPLLLVDANRATVDVPTVLCVFDELDVQVTAFWKAYLLYFLVGVGGDVARRPLQRGGAGA